MYDVTRVVKTRNPKYVTVHCVDRKNGAVARALSTDTAITVGNTVSVRFYPAKDGNGTVAYAFRR